MIFHLALALGAAQAGDSPKSCNMLHGAIADGMCVGEVTPDGDYALVSLLPAQGKGLPIPRPTAKLVDRLLRVHDHGNANLPAELLSEGATSRFCATWSDECLKVSPLSVWPVAADYRHNPPYLLPDGRIRIEWMKDGKLDFLSLITIDDGHVKNIDTAPGMIPMRQTRIPRPVPDEAAPQGN